MILTACALAVMALLLVLILNVGAAISYHRDPATHAARRVLAENRRS